MWGEKGNSYHRFTKYKIFSTSNCGKDYPLLLMPMWVNFLQSRELCNSNLKQQTTITYSITHWTWCRSIQYLLSACKNFKQSESQNSDSNCVNTSSCSILLEPGVSLDLQYRNELPDQPLAPFDIYSSTSLKKKGLITCPYEIPQHIFNF
jgi:hypothetical protein